MNHQPPEWSKRILSWLKRQPRWVLGLGALSILAMGALLLTDMRAPTADQSMPGVTGDPLLNSTGLILNVFIRLILVVIAIYIGAMLLRRWQTGGVRRPDRQLAVLETLHLNQRRSIHLVRAGEQTFLIGATDQAVTLLGEVPNTGTSGKTPENLTFDQHLSAANQQSTDLVSDKQL
jgi:flagellar biosynthetic protein FliO